jgi:hypothetical protein
VAEAGVGAYNAKKLIKLKIKHYSSIILPQSENISSINGVMVVETQSPT